MLGSGGDGCAGGGHAHRVGGGLEGVDADALEASTLERIGMPREIALRHASPHFLHLFSGDGYASGYYSYLWSEVLDADGALARLVEATLKAVADRSAEMAKAAR